MYQNFKSRHFSNQSGIIVPVNWPRAHRVIQLTEASYLGPYSPRMSPRNETVKQGRRQMTKANSPVQWPSWTWCRKWWNHSWWSSRVTLNQRCFAFIRPRTPLVYRYHVISRTQSHGAVFGCASLFDSCATSGRIDYVPGEQRRLRQKQSLDSGIWSRNNEHCRFRTAHQC